MVAALLRMAFFPKLLTRRSAVDKVWYDSNRDADDEVPNSLAMRLSNAVMLLIMIAVISGPIWLIPWPQTLLDGPLGTVRFISYVIGLHLGMVVWPCSYFLLRILVGQTRWVERIKLIALIALCLWLVWGNTREFIAFWTWVWQSVFS